MDSSNEYLSSIRNFVNRLLPFTTPGTPLVQDIIHTLLLCSVLYYAPAILERRTADFLERQQTEQTENAGDDQVFVHDPPIEEPIPLDDLSDTDLNINDPEEPPEPLHENHFPQPGDVNIAGPVNPLNNQHNVPTRDVGKKKAASIARREQKRSYHEFLRSEGEAQRARDREIESALEAELFEEKRRRAVLEQELEEKKKAERDERREKERKIRDAEIARRKKILNIVRTRLEDREWVDMSYVASEVGGGISQETVEKLVRAEGMLRQDNSKGPITVITSAGYVVKVTMEDMREVYQRASLGNYHEDDGFVDWDTLSHILETVIRRKKDVAEGRAQPWDWEREGKALSVAID